MHEYMSLKVSSAEHADLATQLTTLSTQGWNVVNIVSTGTELIAYVSRSQSTSTTMSSASSPSTADNSTGWASVQTAQVAAPQSAPAQTATPAVPADWYPDPSRRYEYRYWDGTKWTDNVARAGVTYKDPPIP